MRAKGMSEKDVESLAWYTDLRRYGSGFSRRSDPSGGCISQLPGIVI